MPMVFMGTMLGPLDLAKRAELGVNFSTTKGDKVCKINQDGVANL
jgi:hypothetical protein